MWFKKKIVEQPKRATKVSEFVEHMKVLPPSISFDDDKVRLSVTYSGRLQLDFNRHETLSGDNAVKLARWILETFD